MKNEKTKAGKPTVYLLSLLIGFAITFLVMILAAALMAVADLPDLFARPLASLSAAAGSFVAGLLASKKLKQGGLVNGAICGGAIFLVVVLVALIISDKAITLTTLFNFIIIMLASSIGGVLGVGGKRAL